MLKKNNLNIIRNNNIYVFIKILTRNKHRKVLIIFNKINYLLLFGKNWYKFFYILLANYFIYFFYNYDICKYYCLTFYIFNKIYLLNYKDKMFYIFRVNKNKFINLFCFIFNNYYNL